MTTVSPAVKRHRAKPLKTCLMPGCFSVSPIAYRCCPFCGNEFPKRKRKPRTGS